MKLIKTILTVSLLCTSYFAQAEVTPLDRVAIVVNDGVILKSEIEALIQQVKQRSVREKQALPADRVLKTQATERLIDNILKKQMAERMSMRIGDTQLDQTIANIAAEQKMTVTQLKSAIESDGVNFATYRETIRDDILLGQVERIAIRRRINISDQEVDNLVDLMKEHGQSNVQYQVGHILIANSDDMSTDGQKATRERADRVLSLLNEGSDFKRVAITSSSGPKALEGGDWGYMNINEMPTLFTDAVAGTSKGDVIGPFKSGNGYHIIKIFDIKGQQQVDVNEVNAKHILIKTSIILSDERAKSMLDGFIKDIESGKATIDELAKKHSDDAGSAIKGGELGWNDPSIYVPSFKDTLARLETNELSQPFKSSHGWHIVQLLGKRKVDATDEFMKNRAYQLMFNRKFTEESSAWAKELRSKAYIDILD
ncbi:peptidylprolyl isomerase SurA [Psychrobium sp. 1_MG-2023]|uniref:peptidylprolyl isomerase SurA n=1 Tax=Psychrobium sp. 1_MG-2023 TaxID=3062624 RepID=UPI000C32EE80|nr:peptidylprolyl isomerase SurA [Psychrobium sp. 1_MG-2023]MDP2559588.1 peptidylprolyl isomerase SurA [Psychrobium sp. 1_MG-2023]PKF59422.1 peptidylprolyl isomerase SurA [Alteromonadales bacterium alter-6D02]